MSAHATIRTARIYIGNRFAGTLSEQAADFIFVYDSSYLQSKVPAPVSLLMPVKQHEHRSNGRLHPFFTGLMQEGWLKRLADRDGDVTGVLGYLVRYCGDTIGDVAVGPVDQQEPPTPSPLELRTDERLKPMIAREACLYCMANLPKPGHNLNYHESCAQELFGTTKPPRFSIGPDDFERLAVASLSSGIALPGVQKKVPVYYSEGDSHYILKPQVDGVRAVPEIEHLWMRLARELGIVTARCGLVEIEDGSLVYVTKRFDRTTDSGKLHMEDFAQLTGKGPFEQEKFDAAMRDIAKIVRRFAKPWKLSLERLVRQMLFNHVFGNHDAHLKNFSIIGLPQPGAGIMYQLSPAYDLLPTRFINGRGPQSALSINGKRDEIVMADLVAEAAEMGVPVSRVEAFFAELAGRTGAIDEGMRRSFVPQGILTEFRKQINKRLRGLRRSAVL